MEEVLCAMALKSTNGLQKHHTQAGLHVCCERALKSAGKRNTHGGGRCGKPPVRKDKWRSGGVARRPCVVRCVVCGGGCGCVWLAACGFALRSAQANC
jgi:hypothetical protein